MNVFVCEEQNSAKNPQCNAIWRRFLMFQHLHSVNSLPGMQNIHVNMVSKWP
jgi:hypothetical protein